MKKQVYEIDGLGYLKEIHVKDFDEQGNCTEELAENMITTDVPQGLYRAKWNGTEWLEDMSQAEIDALNNIVTELTTEEKIEAMAVELVAVQAQLEASQEALDYIIMGGM